MISQLDNEKNWLTLGKLEAPGLLQGDAADDEVEVKWGCELVCCAGGVPSFASAGPSGEDTGLTAGETVVRLLLFA